MLGNLNGWHLLILLAVILLLFGAAKLPALAKSVGQSARVFKGEMKAMKDEEDKTTAAGGATASSTAVEPSSPPSSTAPADSAEPKP
jgi:sec-independent protein translocase protein TatA